MSPCAMFLRRLRTSAALRRGAIDGGVLAALRAELAHELPSHCQDAPDFVTVSDAPLAEDLLLRRRADSEEVLVSAVLAPRMFEGHDHEPLDRDLLMKVFVSKLGATPVLHFDCRAFLWFRDEWMRKPGGAEFFIDAVRYHSSPGDDGEDKNEAPKFRDLDPRLKDAFKEYLAARGISSKLAFSILLHLYQKERAQYLNWLKTMEEKFAKDHH